ncbi:hypothetical protein ACLB0R_08580 [Sphingomonas sp. GlSt437]
MNRPALSIVVPCYNEESCLDLLHVGVSSAARAADAVNEAARG